ncbi:MAG: alpha,alpha-trehalose-phosphate synthase (UDP-forming), partial [Deltaproteobacteria bacterium]
MGAAELSEIVARASSGAKLIVVSNREPVSHEHRPEGIRTVRPASGMVAAIEPIVRAVGGTWIAHGSGSADRLVTDARDRIGLPGDDPRYVLRRLWLSRDEEKGYYHGLSNTALWPLCHIVYTRPHFSRCDWETYRAVNGKFRDAVLDEADDGPAIVFIQDYHLALLPRLLKEARPELKLIQFWHIPWPNREAFRIFPWGEELLDGLLGNDLLGFHIQQHCNNFLETVDRGIESRVDYEHFCAFRGGRPTYVRAFPISVDFAQIGRDAESPDVSRRRAAFAKDLGAGAPGETMLFVGADRIDYTKGIPERFNAFDKMLERHPELKGKVCLVQLAAPSRTSVAAYRELNRELDALVKSINRRHGEGGAPSGGFFEGLRRLLGGGGAGAKGWVPIRFLRAQHDYYAVLAACRMARVALVTSLHDGMNLVAKEFVSARTDGDGILILSEYTGAAREL